MHPSDIYWHGIFSYPQESIIVWWWICSISSGWGCVSQALDCFAYHENMVVVTWWAEVWPWKLDHSSLYYQSFHFVLEGKALHCRFFGLHNQLIKNLQRRKFNLGPLCYIALNIPNRLVSVQLWANWDRYVPWQLVILQEDCASLPVYLPPVRTPATASSSAAKCRVIVPWPSPCLEDKPV